MKRSLYVVFDGDVVFGIEGKWVGIVLRRREDCIPAGRFSLDFLEAISTSTLPLLRSFSFLFLLPPVTMSRGGLGESAAIRIEIELERSQL